MREIEIKELRSKVVAEVKIIMGEGFNIVEREVGKNNGLVFHAINIIEIGKELAPLFYIEPYINAYEKGKSVNEIAQDICANYITCIHEQKMMVDVKEVLSFEKVQDKITFKLINAEKNIDNLSNMPHRMFLDLAVVYQVNLDIEGELSPTITVNNLILRKWGVSEEELYVLAKINTRTLFGYEIQSLEAMINEMLGLTKDCDNKEIEDGADPLYVLSNSKKINGSAAMLYDDVLREFAKEHNANFYILPSSIHEVLLFPEIQGIDKESLKDMVKEVNRTQVLPDEVLSDNVYYFDRDKNDIANV